MEQRLYGVDAFTRASRAAAAAWSRRAYARAGAVGGAAASSTARARTTAGASWAHQTPSGTRGARSEVALPRTLQEAYAALHLQPGAPQPVVKAAYRALAQVHHPDAGGDTAVMARINAAYSTICSAAC